MQADVGSHCRECVAASRPAARERAVMWSAGRHDLVTRTLIGINVLVFLWVVGGGGTGIALGSGINTRQVDLALFVGPLGVGDNVTNLEVFGGLAGGEWYRVVTSGFLHFGVLHIAMNMLLLFQLGQILERRLGGTQFALLYFAALFGGAAGAVITAPNGVTGGASGAVFGLMAATAVDLWQRGINPMQTSIGSLLILNLVLTFSISGISIGGHVGGALFGAATGYAMLERRWRRVMPAVTWIAPLAAMLVAMGVIVSRV